jgi:hypothetical protein
MYKVSYSYVVNRRDGSKKESGTGSVEVNASSENDARVAAEGLARKVKCYEQGTYFASFRVESVLRH